MSGRTRIIMGCLFLFAASVAGEWAVPDAAAQETIVAIVNNEIITQKDVDDFARFMKAQLSREYPEEQLDARVRSLHADLLDRLIEDRLILQEARRTQVTADETKVKERIAEIKKRYESDAAFQEAIGRQGLVPADLENRIREQQLMYKIVDVQVRRKVTINPGEITEYYQQNISDFKSDEQREFDSIAFEDQTLAREVSGRLKMQEDLLDLALKYGLKVSKFGATRGELKKEISDIVFSQQVGDWSAPSKIDEKYYLFRVNKIIPAREKNCAEVQDSIYKYIFEKKLREEMVRWVGQLRKKSYIKIISPEYRQHQLG